MALMCSATSMFGGEAVRGKRRAICGVVSTLGFLFILGTTGACEQDLISLTQFIIQSLVGMVLFAGGAYLGGFMY